MDEMLFDRERFLLLLDELPDPLHITDSQSRIVLMNKAFKRLNAEVGLPADVEGKLLWEVYPFLGEEVREQYRRVLERGETVVAEEVNALRDRRIYTETRKTPFPLGAQRTGVLTLMRDITVHKLVSGTLPEERQLFMGGPVVVFIWGAEGEQPVEYVSPNVAEAFGHSVEDLLLGKEVYARLIHPQDLPGRTEALRRLASERSSRCEQEYRLRHADGGYRWVHDFTIARRDGAGKILRYHGYVMDVTAHRLAEEEARRRSA